MSGRAVRPAATEPRAILVVDDDRRVVELLNIALSARGYRVLTAGDGEEALRVAQSERPDLVVLDVRLPRKSGLEVCERLRQDPDDPLVPIIMVSAAAETEARLQGLARGADDYLAKPFSPKELIARIERQLLRAQDTREAHRRGQEAERELARAREDVKRSHRELQREQRLRELMQRATRELHGTLDPDEVAQRALFAIQSQLEVGVVALLGPAVAEEPLVPLAVRGDAFERISLLEVRERGELAALLQGLGRPVRRIELERFPELRDELAPFVAAGFTLLAPLRGPDGLEGVLLAEDRPDGRDHVRDELEALQTLCDAAAVALHNARRCRAHAMRLLDAATGSRSTSAAAAESAALADQAARLLGLEPRERTSLMRAAELGAFGATAAARETIGTLAQQDPSGGLSALARWLESADRDVDRDPAAEPARSAELLRVARAYASHRESGLGWRAAIAAALDLDHSPIDPAVAEAFHAAAHARAPLEDSSAA